MRIVVRESSGSHNVTTSFLSLHCSAIFRLLLCSVLVSSCNGYANVIYPSEEDTPLTFNYIDTVNFTWISNITDPWMNLWCSPTPTSAQSHTYGKAYLAPRKAPHPFAIPRQENPSNRKPSAETR